MCNSVLAAYRTFLAQRWTIYETDKELILTYKKCLKIGNKNIRKKEQKRKEGRWIKNMIRQFTAEMQMANKQIKRCSTSQAVVEMQIKRTMRCHFPPIRFEKNIKY